MAVRIPVYERHVQLDSGAQTIPRFSASTELGKAVKEAGGAMISVAAHWRAKQDSFDKMQMAANVGTYHAEIQQIIAEETAKFNPAVDRPGVLHDRIMERVAVANQKFQSTAPPSLASEYKIKGDASQSQTSYTSAGHESTIRNSYGRSFLDKQVADIAASVVKNPDAHPTAIAQVKQAIKDAAPASGLSPSQQRALEDTYLDTVGKNVIKGYMATGRADDAAKFREQFVKDREAELPVQFQAPTVVKPQTQLPGGATGPVEGKLNEKRIAEIDKNPTVKAAIEKAAAENGLDPQALKVFASIEFERQSEGRHRQASGSLQSDHRRVRYVQRRQGQHPRRQRQCAGRRQGAGAEERPVDPAAWPGADDGGTLRRASIRAWAVSPRTCRIRINPRGRRCCAEGRSDRQRRGEPRMGKSNQRQRTERCDQAALRRRRQPNHLQGVHGDQRDEGTGRQHRRGDHQRAHGAEAGGAADGGGLGGRHRSPPTHGPRPMSAPSMSAGYSQRGRWPGTSSRPPSRSMRRARTVTSAAA